jgi:hypothetical protein
MKFQPAQVGEEIPVIHDNFPGQQINRLNRTGWYTFFTSHIAGWSERSGKTTPLQQKLKLLGSSLKTPP